MFDYSALRLRNAGFSSGVKSSATKEYFGYPAQHLRSPDRTGYFIDPNNKSGLPHTARLFFAGRWIASVICVISVVLNLRTFFKSSLSDSYNESSFVMHKARLLTPLNSLLLEKRSKNRQSSKDFDTVRATVSRACCTGSNPIMVDIRANQHDVLDVRRRNIAF